MKTTDMQVHEGKNIKRIREILGIKQEALAIDLGLTQQAVSLLEQKETLDAPVLEKVAKSLKVPVETISNFDEQSTSNFINTFNDNSTNNGPLGNIHCTFNPFDKVVELYEALLKSEREKIALLEKMVEK